MPLFYQPKTHEVDIQTIEDRLSSEVPEEIVEELYRFGGLMVTEVQQRRGSLDQKLNSMLGWSTAALALLLTRGDSLAKLNGLWKAILLFSGLFALSAVLCAAFGLKSRLQPTSSENDWFQGEMDMNEPEQMKKYHIVSMLVVHQSQNRLSTSKAMFLWYSEMCLAISSIGIMVALGALLV